MIWHGTRRNDAAYRWLCELVEANLRPSILTTPPVVLGASDQADKRRLKCLPRCIPTVECLRISVYLAKAPEWTDRQKS
jgi:hypothetical protein